MILKKLDPSWSPSEARFLQVGETIEWGGDATQLVKDGMVVEVDEKGNVLSKVDYVSSPFDNKQAKTADELVKYFKQKGTVMDQTIENALKEQVRRIVSEIIGRLLLRAMARPEMLSEVVTAKASGELDSELIGNVTAMLKQIEEDTYQKMYGKVSGARRSYGK